MTGTNRIMIYGTSIALQSDPIKVARVIQFT